MGTEPVVVAIDAIKASFEVYERRHLELMLLKAYIGFVGARHDSAFGKQCVIATGSWGCGAFYNNERVMFVIQAMAANLADVKLTHHILGDGFRLSPAFGFLEDAIVKKLSVSQTLDALAERCATDTEWRSKFKPSQTQPNRKSQL